MSDEIKKADEVMERLHSRMRESYKRRAEGRGRYGMKPWYLIVGILTGIAGAIVFRADHVVGGVLVVFSVWSIIVGLIEDDKWTCL